MVVKVDQRGHVLDFGHIRARDPAIAIGLARQQEANRTATHGVTGRLSVSGGVAQRKDILAVRTFVDKTTALSSDGSTKATLDASLALVNDALDALFFDANAAAATIGVAQVTYAGGGTKASPITAITGAGTALSTSTTAAIMNPIRDQIDTNMITAAALINRVIRATGHEPLGIEFSPMRQPPPDVYGAGSPDTPTSPAGGSGQAFGKDSPFTDPTPAITESSGTHVANGLTDVSLDGALDTWRNNVETMATRLALVTNTVVALTDSSTGTAQATIKDIAAFPADTADSSTSLAQKAATETEMGDIVDAFNSLWDKANELSAGLGHATRTYDGGGTGSDTLAAIGAVTAAATGVLQANMATWLTDIETTTDALAEFVNDLCDRSGVAQIVRVTVTSSFLFDNPVNPLQEKASLNATEQALSRFATHQQDPSPGSAIGTEGGTAADPGQQKADVDTRFANIADNIASLAAKVNGIRSALADPLVRIV